MVQRPQRPDSLSPQRGDRKKHPGRQETRGKRKEPRSSNHVARPIRPRLIEPEIPVDVEAKMLPGKVRAELLSLSSENAEVVARQMVMIDRLLATGEKSDLELAFAFGQAASERAGRVGVVRQYAGRAALLLGDFAVAKRHLSAAHRITGQAFLKVLLAECESGLGKPRKALDLLGEVPSSLLSPREMTYALLLSAEARQALGQGDAARVTLNPRNEKIFEDAENKGNMELLRTKARWFALKGQLTS